MRVLHWCATFNSLSQTFLYDYFVTMAGMGIDTWVATHHRQNADVFPFDNVIEVPLPNLCRPRPILNRIQRELGLRDPLRGYNEELIANSLRECRPDVIHAHMGNEGPRLVLAAEVLSVPLVVSFHGRDATVWLADPRQRRVGPRTFARAAAFTTVSECMRQLLTARGCPPEKVSVVSAGIDLKRFEFRETLPRHDELRVLCIGRLAEKKGYAYLLEAVHLLRDKIPALRVRIIGGGPLESELSRLASALCLTDIVSFEGAQPREAVEKAMRWADLFALASVTAADGDTEGIPTVLMEAQAVGLPLVTTRHAGIPEGIPPGNHRLLSPERDAQALADTMVYLHEHRDEWDCIRQLGRQWVVAHFQVSDQTQRYVDIYRRLLGEGPR